MEIAEVAEVVEEYVYGAPFSLVLRVWTDGE